MGDNFGGPRRLCNARAHLLVAVCALVIVAGLTGVTPAKAAAMPFTPAVAEPVIGNAYTALSPCRIEDTRTTAPLSAGASLNVAVVGTFCSTETVPSGATAVVMNATVTQPNDNGYVSLYPEGSPSTISNLNFGADETVANLVTVGIGTSNSVTVFNGQPAGALQMVLDLEGYYASPGGSTAGQYVALPPARISDTRSGSGLPNAGMPLTAGTTLNVQVEGAGGVPASGVTAVVFNLTATDVTQPTYVTVWPAGATQPVTSNLNLAAGQTRPNRVIVPVGGSGQVSLFNPAGSIDVVVDVNGDYTDATATAGAGSLFTPVSPVRIEDTRTDGNTLGPGSVLQLAITTSTGGNLHATALAENVTEAGATAGSYITVFPTGTTLPTASDINFGPNLIVPNFVQATLNGSDQQSIFNCCGSADVVVDVFGFFAPGPIVSVSAMPGNVQADGTSTSAVTVHVTDAYGTAVTADPITLTTNGSPAGACGALIPSSGPSPLSATYTASSTVGTCTITATEGDTGASSTTVVTQTTAYTLTVTPTTATPTAGVSDSFMLSSSPALPDGTYTLCVGGSSTSACSQTGTPADGSPNGSAATLPTQATFSGGSASVPVTFVDTAHNGTLHFTLTGGSVPAGEAVQGSTSITVGPDVPDTGYVSTAQSPYACGLLSSFSAGAPAQPNAPTSSATQSLSGSADTVVGCSMTLTVNALDQFGNPATGSGTIGAASSNMSDFTVASATVTITSGSGTLGLNVGSGGTFSAHLTLGAASPYNTVVTVSTP